MKGFLKGSMISVALSSSVLVTELAIAETLTQSPAPQSAKAYIISPTDGETVPETFTVTFGLKDMGIAPAGYEKKNTGHHHLLVDKDVLPAFDMPMGSDVKHFGGGQTQTSLTLPKGTHTLQLILGDHHHIPHKPAVVSKKITITVK